jgi:hypothetical protein
VTVTYGQLFVAAVRAWFPPGFFGRFPVRGGVRWTPQRLLWAGLLMGLAAEATLAERFESTGETLAGLFGGWRLGRTYAGFVAAWERQGAALGPAAAARLRRQQAAAAAERLLRCRWRAVAVDGSRFEVPRTRANQAALGRAGRRKAGPQLFLTVAWDLATGLPWDYRIGPGTASERGHLGALLGDLPAGALILADAGFAGYDLARAILASGRQFLIRVGGNCRLLTGLGFAAEERADTVYLWPRDRRSQPPLALRRVVVGAGAKAAHLLTSVADPAALTDEEAAVLYRLRWEAEVGFRSIKQTLRRRRLRSGSPGAAAVELTWALLGLWALGAVAVAAQLRRGADPLAWSVALARKVVRRALRRRWRPARGPGALARELAAAVRDGYVRHGAKAARDWPRKKTEKPPGAPKVTAADGALIRRAKEIRENMAA